MSITRDYKMIVFECDNCGKYLATGEDNFTLAKEQLDAEEWTADKDEKTGEWRHLCDDCQNEIKEVKG